MFNRLTIQSIVASAVLGFALTVSAGTAMAGGTTCDPQKQICPPTCNPKTQNCPPACDPKTQLCDLCHNIGGPNALGANCDAGNCKIADIVATGDADLIAAFTQALVVCGQVGCNPNNIYGGIVVPFGDAAFDAHFKHGDGFTLVTVDRIHATQPHVAANVGCFAVRHDPDPGN
jgi:hypothetical protein